jgi:hypothetical protein
MAAPENVNDDQFSKVNRAQFPKAEDHHKTVLSSIEDSFDMRITPTGIEHEGRTIPAGSMSSIGNPNGRRAGGDRISDSYVFHTTLFREDPRHRDHLTFISKPTADGGSYNRVVTDQHHDYPVYDDKGEPSPDEHISLRRHQPHDDLPSALQHLSESADQRSRWLEMKETPPHGPSEIWQGGVGQGNISWTAATPTSPKTIEHSTNDDPTVYQVDTGTRERIPKEDQ